MMATPEEYAGEKFQPHETSKKTCLEKQNERGVIIQKKLVYFNIRGYLDTISNNMWILLGRKLDFAWVKKYQQKLDVQVTPAIKNYQRNHSINFRVRFSS